MGGTAGAAEAPVVERPIYALSDAELSARLTEVFAAEQTLAARRFELIAKIDGRGQPIREGATGTVSWLRDKLRIKAGTAAHMIRLARSLAGPLAATAQALSEARINVEQAEVIHRAVNGLGQEFGEAVREKAEQVLIGFAEQFEPHHLAMLGSRILEHVDPEAAEEHQRRALERMEARAWRERGFTMTPDGLGGVKLRGLLDTESAATVAAAIAPLCTPAQARAKDARRAAEGAAEGGVGGGADGGADGGVGGGAESTAAQRRADALVAVCRLALATRELPTHGGEPAQVVVTMHFEPGADGATPVGRLDTGETVSPATLRRMACDAGVIPAVLGGDGQVLDVGRQQRLFPNSIRKALVLRDRGCSFPDCDRPPRWTECHHIKHWIDGGETSLDNATLLCRLCRRRHKPHYAEYWIMPRCVVRSLRCKGCVVGSAA